MNTTMYQAHGKHLLLVEDEVLIAANEKQQLENYGYTVSTVSSGEKAVAAVQALPDVDLILMDINLGRGIDGTQAAELILQDRDVPIVFLSSHSDPLVVEKTEKITSYGYVVKNSNIAVLDASIKMAFKLFGAKVTENRKHRLLSMAEETIGMGSWSWIPRTNEVRWSDNLCRLFGIQPGDFEREFSFADQFTHPDDREIVDGFVEYVLTRKAGPPPALYRIITASGETRWVQGNATVALDRQGEIVEVFGTLVDITKRKRAEADLEDREAELTAILDNSPWLIAEFDLDGRYLLANPAAAAVFGLQPSEITGRTFGDLLPKTVAARFRERVDKVRSTGKVLHVDDVIEAIETVDGARHYLTTLFPVRYRGGELHSIGSIAIDVTEQKLIERDMKTMSSLQSIILRMASDYINKPIDRLDETIGAALRQIGEFVAADRAYVFEYDWDRDVASNTHEWCADGVRPEIHNLQGLPNNVIHYWVEAHKSGRDVCIEDVLRLPTEDGVRQVLEPQGVKSVLALPMMRSGQCIGFVGFDSVRAIRTYSDTEKTLLHVFSEMMVNIWHRNELEQNLIHAKQRAEEDRADLTAIIEGATASIWSFDENFELRYGNDRFRSGFHAAFGIWLEPGVNAIDALPEPLRPVWRPRYERVLANEQFVLTDEVDTPKGRRVVQVSFSPIVQGDRVIGGACFGSDITDRAIAAMEIQKQLEEKEALLREVHHRVKNNMAAIESLLSLQAGSTRVPEARTALQDTMSRVHSVQALYERLLVGDNLNEVSIKPYADGLIDAIITVFDPQNSVYVGREIDDFEISPKAAFNLGIIINELLTNVFKHAFTDHEVGEVSVSIRRRVSSVLLVIRDNGAGFSEAVLSDEEPGFGLTVIRMLSEQSGGTCRYTNENGARSVVEYLL